MQNLDQNFDISLEMTKPIHKPILLISQFTGYLQYPETGAMTVSQMCLIQYSCKKLQCHIYQYKLFTADKISPQYIVKVKKQVESLFFIHVERVPFHFCAIDLLIIILVLRT